MGSHRPFTRQFKEQAVKLVMDGQQEPSRTARELGMPQSTLLLWLKKARPATPRRPARG